MDILHTVLYHGAVDITGWKLIGWSGALCFGARWLVQLWHRQRTGDGAIPTAFWWLSLGGALMTLAYFLVGQPDSVGVLQNVLPLGLASWNLWLDLAAKRTRATPT
jgi:lipid-A-disaccharide synthase-like uncharacterized protein